MKRWLLFLTTILLIATWGWGQERHGKGKFFTANSIWRLLQSPKFRTLTGKLQVTVFFKEGERSWTTELWADEQNSKAQFMVPHPEGARQIITFTRPDGVWVWLPFAKRLIHHERGTWPSWKDFWGLRPDKLDLAQRNYTLRVVGRDRINNLFCLVLELTPRAKGNPVRKIWVHPPTRFPVKVERYSPDGVLEMRVEFTEVKLNQPLPVMIFDPTIPSDWERIEVPFRWEPLMPADAERVLGFPLLLPHWLPPGYIQERIFAMQDRQWKVAHLIYTDGIGVISVFQHPLVKDRPHHRWSPPVHRMLFQRKVLRDIGNVRVLLLSDVAREWLEKMADSLVVMRSE